MRNVLADLALEAEAALALSMRVAGAVDAAPRDASQAAFARIATAIRKFWICKRAAGFVNEAQECPRRRWIRGGIAAAAAVPAGAAQLDLGRQRQHPVPGRAAGARSRAGDGGGAGVVPRVGGRPGGGLRCGAGAVARGRWVRRWNRRRRGRWWRRWRCSCRRRCCCRPGHWRGVLPQPARKPGPGCTERWRRTRISIWSWSGPGLVIGAGVSRWALAAVDGCRAAMDRAAAGGPAPNASP